MHSTSPVVNLAERHETPKFPELRTNSIVIGVIALLIIHCFISLKILQKHKINEIENVLGPTTNML